MGEVQDNPDMLTTTSSLTATKAATASEWNSTGGSTEFSSSFLEHASGQGISGACAWAAILITCHQVKLF